MKGELRGRLNRNLSDLKNTNLIDGLDEFMKDGDITHADSERARSEVTTEEKNRKLINILMTKADGVFDKILNWLTKEGHKDLVKALAKGGEEDYDLTEINQRGKYLSKIQYNPSSLSLSVMCNTTCTADMGYTTLKSICIHYSLHYFHYLMSTVALQEQYLDKVNDVLFV